MNFNNLKYKLMAFMQGRYGPDPRTGAVHPVPLR